MGCRFKSHYLTYPSSVSYFKLFRATSSPQTMTCRIAYRFHIATEFRCAWAPSPFLSVREAREVILRHSKLQLDGQSYLELREANGNKILDDDDAILRVDITPLVVRRRARLLPNQRTLDVVIKVRAPSERRPDMIKEQYTHEPRRTT